MDISKYPLEKLFYFAACIIPGGTALLIYRSAVPGSFNWFFDFDFLGYKTKLGLLFLVCTLVGYTIGALLNMILGVIGGVIGGRAFKNLGRPEVAPWRDPTWRALVRRQLGENCPRDSQMMSKSMFDWRREMVETSEAPLQRAAALLELEIEKSGLERDDLRWEQWYSHYAQMVFRADQDFTWHVRTGLNFNLQTASLYLLISALFVPNVRHWWCLCPAFVWVITLVAQSYSEASQILNSWSTLHRQISYLAALNNKAES